MAGNEKNMGSPSTTSTDDETSATTSTVSSAEFNRNSAKSSTDELDQIFQPTRRTVSGELSSIPIVADTLERVTDMMWSINARLESNLPFYGWSIATMMCTYQGITTRASNYSLYLWLVTFYRGNLLDLIDFIRRNYPEVDLPANEMRERFLGYVRRQIALATSYLASFRLSQISFRALESIVKVLENFCGFLTLDGGRSLDEPWWNMMDLFLQVYELIVNRFLRFMSRHLRQVRYEIKHIRRSGAYVVARDLHIRSRRRVSPRKSGDEKPRKGGWLCLKWLKRFISAILGISRPKPISTIVVGDPKSNSPNIAISSTEKKRKLSAVDEERSYDTEGEMTHHALLTGLETYNSEEDPNYAPTDTSTDSYEYRTSDEEEEDDPTLESEGQVCMNGEADKKASGKDIDSSKAASKEIVPKTGKTEGGKKADKKAAKNGKDKGTKSTPEENGAESSPEVKDKKAKPDSEGKKKK